MRKIRRGKEILAGVMAAAGLYGCLIAGARHGLSDPLGMSPQRLQERFGPPSRVERDARGREVWVYRLAGGKKEWRYVFEQGKVIERR